MRVGRCLSAWLLAVVALALIAWASPEPNRVTDRDVYEAIARQVIIPDCNELHCFRLLVPAILGFIPGPSILVWKAYAVTMNGLAALAVFALCRAWTLSVRAALMSATLSAFGFGALYTLHDAFTADPLMYALGPALTLGLATDRAVLAAVLSTIGVTAKEFAVAPLYVFAAAAWFGGSRSSAWRIVALANTGFILWLTIQLALVVGFNYGYDNNPSTHLLGGGYLRAWWQSLAPSAAMSAILGEFGALWILAPAGWFWATADLRRLSLAALPVAALFAYVQQPDRALWNFHFLATPLAALVLERVPPALAWTVVALFVAANLRIGAQVPWVPAARFALVGSLVLASVSVLRAWRAGPKAGAPAWAAV